MKKRILSVLMVLCLVLAMVPTALAEGEDNGVTPEDPAAPTEVIEEPGNEQQGGGEPAGTLPAGETPEEDSDAKTPANALTTPEPEETSVPEEQVSPQDMGDTPTVEMDNLLVRVNQTAYMSYQIPEGYDETKFTFAFNVDGQFSERYPLSGTSYKRIEYGSHGFQITAVGSATELSGQTATVCALYDDEEVGSCEVLFIPSNGVGSISYTNESGGSSTSLPFATATRITASTTLNISADLGESSITGWKWYSENPDAVGVDIDASNPAQADIIVYQQGSAVAVHAIPTVTVNGTEYALPTNYGSSCRVSARDAVTSSAASIWQGGSAQLTFALPESLTAGGVTVTWASSNEAVIPAPTGTETTVTVTAASSSPITGAYISVRLTATAEIDGRTYSGYVSIYVYKNIIEADATAGTWDGLLQAIQDDSQTIAVSDTIEIPANATLDLTGVQILREDFDGALFSVGSENVTINGGDTGVINGQYNGAAAPLIEVAQGGDLTLSNITLQNSQNNGGTGGAVSVKGGTLTCKGVSFIGNTAQGTTSGSNDYNGGGAIYAQDAVIDISGCTFEGNSATFGNGGTIYADQGTTGTIESNVITGGETSRATSSDSSAGGGIYCRLAGNILIRGNKISGCEAYNGGGIAVVTTGYDFCGKITLIDNTVDGNTADNRGGGLYFVQDKPDTIDLQSGIISNNSAGWGGGIDYTVHDQETLVLTNVLITDNTAVRGAGIWACPTSKTESYSTLGGAIFGNTATGRSTELNPVSASGDDIRYEGTDADVHGEDPLILRGDPWVTATTEITVMDRALGGGLMAWYQDEQSDRYASGDDEADPFLYTQTNLSFSLHGELSAAHQALAEAEARLIITGNTAESRGGGIATNSPIVIGMEGYDKTVTVEKMWSGSETHPASVNVTLVRKDEAGNTVDLETVTLSEDNEWTATFEDLPGLYEDENGTQHNYTYTVREDTIANWTGKVAETSEGNTIELVITNTYQPDPGPGGGGGTTTPDPDPDDKDDDDPEPTPTPTPTPNPDIPVTPDNPDTPDTPNQPDTPSEPVSPSDPGVPQTSDTSLTGLWLALCLLALGGLGLLRFTQPRRGGRRARR